MALAARVGPLNFHVFLGAHSLLIGLLPFYLPVWLWRHGIGLDGLAVLIAVSGFSFAAALPIWRRLGSTLAVSRLVAVSFGLESLLLLVSIAVSALLSDSTHSLAIWMIATVVGIAAGAYNAFFWTTQRVLFAASLGNNDTGKRYGNFQIYVAVLLKTGIVFGGLFLDHDAVLWLLVLSIVIGLGTTLWLRTRLERTPLLPPAQATPPPTDSASIGGRTRATRLVFLCDGVFLLLESHFWTLSLFLLFGEDFTRLGVLVVLLGIAFTVLFWLSKNLVDRFAVRQIYLVAVGLYALSWALRSTVEHFEGATALGVLLIIVTFTTTFFRLSFNKRFFERARDAGVVDYLVWKSQLSQRAIGIVFLGMALSLLFGAGDAARDLSVVYALAAIAALVYLAFRAPNTTASQSHVSLVNTRHDAPHD